MFFCDFHKDSLLSPNKQKKRATSMNDLRLARNLGEMFETATRNISFNSATVALPPSITSFINTNYYNVETSFNRAEIIKCLESSNDNEIYTVLKHLIGKLCISDDEDKVDLEILELFPFIIKNVNSKNLKIKRLVYIILIKFNHLKKDISLLSINAIQKSLSDKNAIDRSLSIRCLSSIKIPAVLPILVLSINQVLKDSSPLVRCACSVAIIKCVRLDVEYNKTKDISERQYIITKLNDDQSIIYQLSLHLETLLSDNDPKVLSLAIQGYYETFNGCYDLIHNKLHNLIQHVDELDDFAIVNFVNIMINYSRLFLKTEEENMSNELLQLYEKLIALLKYSPDYNVATSIIKFLVELFPFKLTELSFNKQLIRLINKDYYNDIDDDNKILIGLSIVMDCVNKGLVAFKDYQISKFLPLFHDNFKIFNVKISILFNLINENNFNRIFREIKFIINQWGKEKNFYKFKVLQKINVLILSQLLNDDQISRIIKFLILKLKFETDDLLIGEYITGLRQLIQNDLENNIQILIKLTGLLIESYEDGQHLLSNAKSSIIWLLSEFSINYTNFMHKDGDCNILKEYLPNLILVLVNNFKNEDSGVKMSILKLVTKFQISRTIENERNFDFMINDKFFKVFNYVLLLSKFETDLDIRDFSRLIGSIFPNVVYFKDLRFEEYSIGDLLQQNDIMNNLSETFKNFDLNILIFQLNKSISSNGNDDYDQIGEMLKKFLTLKGAGTLDPRYLSYYEELRNDGFKLYDYNKYSGFSSASYKSTKKSTETSKSSSEIKPLGSSKVKVNTTKYRLQTLDDFLGEK